MDANTHPRSVLIPTPRFSSPKPQFIRAFAIFIVPVIYVLYVPVCITARDNISHYTQEMSGIVSMAKESMCLLGGL